jgi:L-fuculose-phosphate aldolase
MRKIQALEDSLAHTIRRLYSRGLVSGVGGNASVILPGRKRLVITPSGYFKGGVESGDLVTVTLSGRIIGAGRPSSDLPTHLAIYRLRKDVNAVVHGHPPSAVAMMTAGIDLPTLTPEHAVLVRSVQVVDFVPPGKEGAEAISRVIDGKTDLVGVRNHGFFALGKDLHDAASKIEVIEESSKIYLGMRQLGRVSQLDEDQVARIRRVYRK